MTFASPAEFLAHARLSGLLPSERVDELLTDPTLPDSIDDFLTALHERGILNREMITDAGEGNGVPSPGSSSSGATYVAIPQEDDDEGLEAFSPEMLERAPSGDHLGVHRMASPPMSRSTMWTWIALGGFLWLVGFIILGIWISGCQN